MVMVMAQLVIVIPIPLRIQQLSTLSQLPILLVVLDKP